MDRDANYVAVGAFVLLVIAMGVSFVFWYTDQQDKRTYQRYELYFQGTVSGLTPGSPVRYLGVDVGKVVRILLDPAERNRVQVIADVDSAAPIDGRTRASLSLQGITGLLYIDLQQDKKVPTSGALAQGQHFPVIRTVPSDFDLLLSSLPALATRTIELIDHFDHLLSDHNVDALHATLENVRVASERLPASLRDLQDLALDMRHAAREIQAAAVDLHATATEAAPDVKAAVANVRQVSQSLVAVSDHLDHFVTDNQAGLSRFTSQSLPELERLLHDGRAAANEFRDLSRSLKQNPSQLLFEQNAAGVAVAR